jgi:C_GCAxxG_C_C family probable redox protein
MDRIEVVVSQFKEGFNCAQAILSTYAPLFGIDRKKALKIATPFGAGLGRMGEVCGAVSGALMVLGLDLGRASIEDIDAEEKTYTFVREFIDRFEEKNKSIFCKELLGYDISTPKGLKMVNEKNISGTLCPGFVRDAAVILEDLLVVLRR